MKKLINKICDSIIRAAEAAEEKNVVREKTNVKLVWENTENEYCRIKPLGIYESEIGTLEFDRDGRVRVSTLGSSEVADSALECDRLFIGMSGGAVAEYDAYADTVSFLGYTYTARKGQASGQDFAA